LVIHMEAVHLVNSQQMEVAVNGPDGATHLILCTGIVELDPLPHGTYTFFVGPKLSRRQFVGAIASCALASIQGYGQDLKDEDAKMELGAKLILMGADFDDDCSQVKIRTEVASYIGMSKLAISYHVSILAELPGF